MDDTATVGVGKRPGEFCEDADGVARLETPLSLNPKRERFAFNVPHHEVHEAFFLAEGQERHDVGVRKLGRSARLAPETFAHFGGLRAVGRENLDRNEAIEGGLACEVDGAHAAASEQTLDVERIIDRRLKPLAQGVAGSGVRAERSSAARAEPCPRGCCGSAGRTVQAVALVS